MSLTIKIQNDLTKAISSLFPGTTSNAKPIMGKKDDQYRWSGAPSLSKELKLPPGEIAEKIVNHLKLSSEVVDSCEIYGSGILSIAVKADAIAKELELIHQDARLGVRIPEKKERVIVEFSSPNVAKELHVGHLRSTIIGECLARLFEFIGHDTIRLNHIGDWGTQFGMLIWYLKINGIKSSSLDLAGLMECYRNAKVCFDKDENFKKNAKNEVVKLQSGDSESKKVWEEICEVSRKDYQEIYNILDVTITERGESFYNDMLGPIIEDLLKRGIAEESEGAVLVRIEGQKTPFILRKSDGGYTYDTTDVGACKHRVDVEKADRIIYVVDKGQSLHFQLLNKVMLKAGYLDPKKTEFKHVDFGVVLGADGKKFKTRSGETVRLKDLLKDSIEKAKSVLQERLKGEYQQEDAVILGVGALKYADLKNNRKNDYSFDPDRMLKLEGNTIAFLLYSLVRIKSIEKSLEKKGEIGPFVLNHPAEKSLGLHLKRFDEVLEMVLQTLEPHHLCEYLYDLASKFNKFYYECPVKGVAEEASRLRLCDLTKKIEETGLHILGIKTLEKM